MKGEAVRTLPPRYLSAPPPNDQEMFDLISSSNPAATDMIFNAAYLAEQYPSGMVAKARCKVMELRAAYNKALGQVDVLITSCPANSGHETPWAGVECGEDHARSWRATRAPLMSGATQR
ncbi:uncharacterized protein A1O9_05386 [Exophiala aquamarina CBS 119918]|uniref:Uncharacterized protein n=1 Tax=Exophiala aquamarina CBS 119918 TaxID=1182545 RepID=A0A072PBI6_9EURO|nr:uncharacterized protein A1O9_05386 [Exophiala aquamarina CBS 119918]KEF57469.1 hypothetical protein A1O9_05386 [Exophiala aquamarina CBS 119918]